MEKYPTPFERAAKLLIERAYSEIERKYGEKGLTPKKYHNVQHSKDVVAATEAIADKAIESGKITPKDKILLSIAAAYHDFEQDLGDDAANVEESAMQACWQMEEAGVFSYDDIEQVAHTIFGTVVRHKDGHLLQAGGDIFAQILADADLSNLGSDQDRYWDRALSLFAELHPDNRGMEAFMRENHDLLAHHKYFTDEARELFPHQSDNLDFTLAISAGSFSS
jgi:hypothetical protein